MWYHALFRTCLLGAVPAVSVFSSTFYHALLRTYLLGAVPAVPPQALHRPLRGGGEPQADAGIQARQ